MNSAPERADDGSAQEEKFEEVRVRDEIDEKLGFWRWEGGGAKNGEKDQREGWLVNMHQVGWGFLSSVYSLGGLKGVEGGGGREGRRDKGRKERRVERADLCSFRSIRFLNRTDAHEGRHHPRRESSYRSLLYSRQWRYVQDDSTVRTLLLRWVQGELLLLLPPSLPFRAKGRKRASKPELRFDSRWV